MLDLEILLGLGVANNMRLGSREVSKVQVSAELSMLRVVARMVL